MELRALKYFAAVVEAGSLTAAAAHLRLSQPSLSVAISKLEVEVGTPLLTRSPRGVEPTSAGRYLLDSSSRVLGDVEDIVRTLARYGAGAAGSLAIAAVPVLMWHRLPQLLRTLAAEAADLEIKLLDPPPWTAIDMLLQRTVDAAAVLVANPEEFARRHRAELRVTDWGPVPLVAALPRACAGAGTDVQRGVDAADGVGVSGQVPSAPLALSAFQGRRVVLPRRTAAVPSLPEAVEAAFAAHGVTPDEVRTTETMQTAVPLIEAGVAWGVLPDPDHESLARFDLDVYQLEPAPEPLRALVLTRRSDRPDPALARLLRHIDVAD